MKALTNIPGIPMNPSMPVETEVAKIVTKLRDNAKLYDYEERPMLHQAATLLERLARERDELRDHACAAEAALEGMKEQRDGLAKRLDLAGHRFGLLWEAYCIFVSNGGGSLARHAEPLLKETRTWQRACTTDASREQGRKG